MLACIREFWRQNFEIESKGQSPARLSCSWTKPREDKAPLVIKLADLANNTGIFSPRNMTLARNFIVNEKITAPYQTNISPKSHVTNNNNELLKRLA